MPELAHEIDGSGRVVLVTLALGVPFVVAGLTGDKAEVCALAPLDCAGNREKRTARKQRAIHPASPIAKIRAAGYLMPAYP